MREAVLNWLKSYSGNSQQFAQIDNSKLLCMHDVDFIC